MHQMLANCNSAGFLPEVIVAAVVKGHKSVYWRRRKTRKTCFIYKAS